MDEHKKRMYSDEEVFVCYVKFGQPSAFTTKLQVFGLISNLRDLLQSYLPERNPQLVC